MYKIMLVDDEDEVREGITATVDFAACGFTLCAQATGAIDAIEKAAQFQPDVVFTDVHMPYMDGMEMISRLQEMYPTMKYIVLSGYDDFIYVKQALQRQVLDYLLKPLSAQGIMKVLRRAKEQLDEQDRQRVNLEILRDKVAKNAQQLRRAVQRAVPGIRRPAQAQPATAHGQRHVLQYRFVDLHPGHITAPPLKSCILPALRWVSPSCSMQCFQR